MDGEGGWVGEGDGEGEKKAEKSLAVSECDCILREGTLSLLGE